jgi:excisionase family DNA binding protein
MQMQAEKMFRVSELAALLGVKEATIRKWVQLRKIAYVKLNGCAVRIAESEVRRLIADGHVAARPERP